MSDARLRRIARAVYRPDRWPGNVLWPALARLPSIIPPGWARRTLRRTPPQKIAMLCVYRNDNAHHVKRLIDGLLSQAAGGNSAPEVRLWALDRPADSLRAWTVGCGPGARCDLINALLAEIETALDVVVVVDDDVELVDGWDLRAFIGAMILVRVDFAQPAHVSGSLHTHAFNHRRPLIAGRRVAAVEIGPVFAVRGDWIGRVLPFAEGSGMGYFLEWAWGDLARDGCRVAVLDCVRMKHLSPVGSRYADVQLGQSAPSAVHAVMTLDEHLRQDLYFGKFVWPMPRLSLGASRHEMPAGS